MRITVFTPAYNRAHLLGRLYDSLRAQTFRDFEWLVIDDGSVDNTGALFDVWKADRNDFVIRYVYAENKGKMKEMNAAMELAEGELFFTVDSDDILVPDALEKIDRWERAMPRDGSFCGLAGNMGWSKTDSNNPTLPGDFYDATLFHRLRDYGGICIGADRAWVFYTDVYRRYKFPEFEGEKFIAEAVSWNRMAHDGLKVRCFNDIIYIFEQLQGGLTDTMSRTLINSPRGYGLWKAELIRFRRYPLKRRLKEYYIFYCDLAGKHPWQQIAEFIQAPKAWMRLIHFAYRIKHGGTNTND